MRGRTWLAALALLGLAGCGPDVGEVIGAEYIVRDISFVGVERFDEDTIIEHMVLGETSVLPFTETYYFNAGLLPKDLDRIEALYQAYGYYEARVMDVEVQTDEDAGEVNLVITIDEGEPVKVGDIDFTWAGEPEPEPDAPADADPTEAVERRSALELEAPFEVPALNRSVTDMRLAIQERGYALAKVQERAVIDRPMRRASVDFDLEPGPRVHIGELELTGLEQVPRDLVVREIDYVKGRLYAPTLVEAVEKKVYALDMFRSVVVTHAEQPNPDNTLDLEVRVDEARPQSVRVGVGAGFEPNRWEQRVSARYTHRNLFGRLYRFNLRGHAGYAELPSLIEEVKEHGPIVMIEPSLEKKGILEDKLIWRLSAPFELGIEEGYQFYSPSGRLGVTRFFGTWLEVELGHDVRYTDFFDLTENFNANRTRLRFDFRDPYLLSFASTGVRFHFTDRLLDPEDGAVFGTRYAISSQALGSDFDYHRITPTAKAFWTPVKRRLRLAWRAETGLILPFGDRPGAPVDEKYYLGGADTVRGWGLRRLSPQVCVEGETETTCRGTPVGGNTMVLFNFETSVRALGDLWVATFLDAGDVRPGELDYDLTQLAYSSGLGFRYATPIGKIRADFGFRINETKGFEDESRWAFHLGLGEPF